MKSKTQFASLVLMLVAGSLFAQAPQFCEKMDMRATSTDAQLELSCANCADITEIQLYGDGVAFTGIYHGDAWKQKFPRSLDLTSGDYTLRVKGNNGKWKTMHLYVPRKKKETMALN
jgi:hypothetical protein